MYPLKIICTIRGWWWTLRKDFGSNFTGDLTRISGHTGRERHGGKITCTTCGKIMFDAED